MDILSLCNFQKPFAMAVQNNRLLLLLTFRKFPNILLSEIISDETILMIFFERPYFTVHENVRH